jgi:NitT/TauT family transport system ATP-binding protein
MRAIIENLSKTFHDGSGHPIEALRHVQFSIEENEFVAVVGPSGCGKTTLLHIIAGLLPADDGRVLFEGALSNGRPQTSIVFQDLALFPWRNVVRNVSYGLEELGFSKAKRKQLSNKFIDLVGLKGFEHKYPHQLSGGMKQRTAIARALSLHPMLLLMDEPFSALDAQTRMLMQLELARIYEKTRQSVLYITHYIPEAVFLSDRVVVMSRRPGRIVQIIQIDLPRPRKEQIKVDPSFVAYLDDIWTLIREQQGDRLE